MPRGGEPRLSFELADATVEDPQAKEVVGDVVGYIVPKRYPRLQGGLSDEQQRALRDAVADWEAPQIDIEDVRQAMRRINELQWRRRATDEESSES